MQKFFAHYNVKETTVQYCTNIYRIVKTELRCTEITTDRNTPDYSTMSYECRLFPRYEVKKGEKEIF